MYVAKVPNRGSPPAVLLRESYREGGKVKNRTLANLSSWPEAKVDALAAVLKGQPVPAAAAQEETFEITRSLPHGHVAAVLGTAQALGLEELIDPEPSRQRDLVTAMTVAQVIAPDSKLAIARGLQAGTAASSLGQVLHLGGCDEDDLYAAMDWLAARQEKIQDALAARHLAGGPWSSTTSPVPRPGGGPARSAPSGTPKTGCGAGLVLVSGAARQTLPLDVGDGPGGAADIDNLPLLREGRNVRGGSRRDPFGMFFNLRQPDPPPCRPTSVVQITMNQVCDLRKSQVTWVSWKASLIEC